MPEITNKKLIRVIREWDTFTISPTSNGFILGETRDIDGPSSLIAKDVAEAQDFLEAWAKEKSKGKKRNDEDDGDASD
jgi:hypothetical protein